MAEDSLLDLDTHLKALEPFFVNSYKFLEELNKHSTDLTSLLLRMSESSENLSDTYEDLLGKHEKLIKKYKKL